MTISIKSVVTPSGEQLINVPADPEILKTSVFRQSKQLSFVLTLLKPFNWKTP